MAEEIFFYSPKKTFIESLQGYAGDLDKAFELFMDQRDSSTEDDPRTLSESLGVSVQDMIAFLDGSISIQSLIKKY